MANVKMTKSLNELSHGIILWNYPPSRQCIHCLIAHITG